MDDEEALWFSWLFICHYNPGSAWVMFHESPPFSYKRIPLPIEPARRALHGGKIFNALDDLIRRSKQAGGLRAYFQQDFNSNPLHNWWALRDNIGAIYGCGRWAEYTFGEILQKVHGFNVQPTDMGNESSSGPRNGLILLMGNDSSQAEVELYNLVKANISIPWFDWAVLESVSCDFNSLNKGRYYIGRDIDRQQYRILRAEQATKTTLTPLWEARKRVFPHQYLGELNTWFGIEKDRLRHYIETGEVIDR